MIERDAPASPLPDQDDVPSNGEQAARSNDTIQPGVLGGDGVSLDGDGELGAAGDDAVADTSPRNRLPTGMLAGLLGPVVLAAAGVGLWMVRRRGEATAPED